MPAVLPPPLVDTYPMEILALAAEQASRCEPNAMEMPSSTRTTTLRPCKNENKTAHASTTRPNIIHTNTVRPASTSTLTPTLTHAQTDANAQAQSPTPTQEQAQAKAQTRVQSHTQSQSPRSPPHATSPPRQPLQLQGIEEPNPNDVLSGRGNSVNYHPGNLHFRRLVKQIKIPYVAAQKQEKPFFSKSIVQSIRNSGGRFLKQDRKTGLWYDIGEKQALTKTRQALREGAPKIEVAMQLIHHQKQQEEIRKMM